MLNDVFTWLFKIETIMVAGGCLWSLALYIGLPSVREWLIEQLDRWFNFAERSLYTSQQEYENTRPSREAVNALYASVFSIVPFLVVGLICNYLVEIALGHSWGISLGILACVSCGIYELGKRDNNREQEK